MWLKLSDDFDDHLGDLSSDAFRVHVQGLLHVMRREKSPVLTRRDVRRFADVEDPDAAVVELLKAGLWISEPEGKVRIVHQMEHQIEPEVIAARKAANAARQRRHRLKKAGLADADEKPKGEDVTRYVTPGTTDDPGLVGAGLGGTGSTRSSSPKGSSHATEPKALGEDWPAVRLPGFRVNEY